MIKVYAGVGSRETPESVLEDMELLAISLSGRGWTLRSGGARGADQAFARGAKAKEIFRANDATAEAMRLASEHHPAWNRCSDFVKMLHGRNMQILLGRNLDSPVRCVICWTPGGLVTGGTGQAIRAAHARKIPVYNLFSASSLEIHDRVCLDEEEAR